MHRRKRGDRGSVRIQVHTSHLFQNAPRTLARVGARLVLRPECIQPLKSAEEEVSRTTGRIDQAHLPESEFLDRRAERAVQDELLDEFGRLKQCVLLAGAVGEILIKVAQKAGVPGRIGEVVYQTTRIGIDPLPQTEQVTYGVARRGVIFPREAPERVVPLIEELPRYRQRRNSAEDLQQELPIGVGGVGAEVERVLVERMLAPFSGPG